MVTGQLFFIRESRQSVPNLLCQFLLSVRAKLLNKSVIIVYRKIIDCLISDINLKQKFKEEAKFNRRISELVKKALCFTSFFYHLSLRSRIFLLRCNEYEVEEHTWWLVRYQNSIIEYSVWYQSNLKLKEAIPPKSLITIKYLFFVILF